MLLVLIFLSATILTCSHTLALEVEDPLPNFWLYDHDTIKAETQYLAMEQKEGLASRFGLSGMNADYENGELNSGDSFIDYHTKVEGRVRIEETNARTGSKSIIHELRATDPPVASSTRCESDNMMDKILRAGPGKDMYYGMSFYLSSDWEVEGRGVEQDNILAQWKGFGSAPFMFITQKKQGLYLRVNSHPNPDYDPANDEKTIKKDQYTFYDNVPRDVWIDVKIHVQWEYTDAGILQVDYKTQSETAWKNLVDTTGGNCYNAGGYLKWGVYRPSWKSKSDNSDFQSRIPVHDNIRIGNSLDQVDPTK